MHTKISLNTFKTKANYKESTTKQLQSTVLSLSEYVLLAELKYLQN